MLRTHLFNVMDYTIHHAIRLKNIIFVVSLCLLFPSLSYSKTILLLPLEGGFFNTSSELYSSSTIRVFKIASKVNEFVNLSSYPDYVDIPYSKYQSLSRYLATDAFSLGSSHLIKYGSSSVDLSYYTLRYPDSFAGIQEFSSNSLNYLMDNSNSYQLRGMFYPLVYKALTSTEENISVVIYTTLKDPNVLKSFWEKELSQGKIKRLPTLISLYDPRLDAFSLNFSDNFFDTSSRIIGLTTKLTDDLNRAKLEKNEKKHSLIFASDFDESTTQKVYRIFQSKLRSGVYSVDFSFVEYIKEKSKSSIYRYYSLNSDGTYIKINSDSLLCSSLFTGGG